ncbi:TPA: hypothetical protein ACWV4T_005125 [Salmonella enterica subsp. enterica serovar Muenchen]
MESYQVLLVLFIIYVAGLSLYLAIKHRNKWALLNKSNFQVISGSDRCVHFNIRPLWQSKSLKSPTGPHTIRRSDNVVR